MRQFAAQTACWMSTEMVWLALLHSVWMGLAAAASVALIFQTRRPLSHRSRDRILIVALCLVASGPPALAAVQHLATSRLFLAKLVRESNVVALPGLRDGPSRVTAHLAKANEGGNAAVSDSRCLAVIGAHLQALLQSARPLGLKVWSLSVLGLAATLALGVHGVTQLQREGTTAPAVVQERTRKLARRLRLRGVPAVRLHPRLGQPCLSGSFRPVILLPERWVATVGDGPLDAVLAHELAHARRLDHLVNPAQRIVEVLYFFHPGVHWLSRSLRRQREHCADELAVRLTGDPFALATALESVARLCTNHHAPRPFGAALGGESVSLLPRIQELIGMKPVRTRLQIWPFAALPLAFLLGLVAISAGRAQERAPLSPRVSPPLSRNARALTPGHAAPVPVSPIAATAAAPDPDRQYSFEVRQLDLVERGWRDRLGGRLSPLGAEADSRGWILDGETVNALLNQKDHPSPKGTIVRAPKVTSFEGARATICFGLDKFNASDLEKTLRELDRDPGKSIPGGLVIGLVGTYTPLGTRLSIDLRDSTIPANSGRRDGVQSVDGPPKPAANIVDRYEGSHEVADGSSVLVSLGRHERQVNGQTLRSERLIVITPRRIQVGPDPRSDAKSAQ